MTNAVVGITNKDLTNKVNLNFNSLNDLLCFVVFLFFFVFVGGHVERVV